MSEKYKVGDSQIPHFITFTIVDWVDIFIRRIYKDILIDSIKYCQKEKGLKVHAWVIMSSHLHMIVSTNGKPLQSIVRDLKKYTSREIIKAIKNSSESRNHWMLKKFEYAAIRTKRGGNYKVWQDGFHPIQLDTNEMIDQRLQYIHQNPVVAGIVDREESYIYSSAKDYHGGKGLIELDMID